MSRIDLSQFEDRHAFQVRMCERYGKPVINVACQEDPAFLGEKFDAVNVDMIEKDLHLEDVDYNSSLKNFVKADARSLPYENGSFKTVVLGEFLEHVTEDYARSVLAECARVSSGVIVLTFPFDDRTPEEQHEPEKLYEPVPGYTTYHRTIWSDEMLASLFKKCGLVEVFRASLNYYFTKPLNGLGIVLKKGN